MITEKRQKAIAMLHQPILRKLEKEEKQFLIKYLTELTAYLRRNYE